MKNMKIGVRLGLGFGLMIVITAILVVFGISRISSLNENITLVVKDRMVKTRQANEIVDQVNVTSRALRNIFLQSDPKEVKKEELRMTQAGDTITAKMDSLEASIKTDEGKRLISSVKEKRRVYLEKRKDMLEQFYAGKKAESVELLFGEFREVQADYLGKLSELTTFQTNLAENDGKTASDMASQTVNLLILLGLLALVIGVLVAIWITRSITGPIGRCIAIADKISQGDTTTEVHVDSNDEAGILLASLKRMIEAIQRMGADALMLSKAAVEGKLSTRADASKHQGDFRKVVQGVNDTLDSVINPLNVSAKYVDDISKGVIPAIITDNYNGDFNIIKTNLNSVVKMMSDLLRETDSLVNAALKGSLSTRANATLFLGGWNQLVAGVNKTLDSVLEPINEAAGILDKVAARDMSARVIGNYSGDHAKIKNSLNFAVENLDKALAQVSDATSQVSSASQQISAGSQSLAQGANEQASSLEEVSSSLEEMASMTKQNADNALQAKNLAGESNDSAKVGSEAMTRMSSAILRIKESSDQTAKIVKTIDEIAMQTNLLALNAAVEAARAGEAGRGFAVVAEEVRNLAQRSAQAAKNTADMIGESVKNAEDGVKIAQEVTKSFTEIATGAKKVNDLIAEIAAASKEQSQGIEQVNTAVSQMDKVTQQNAANSEESASAAEELSSQAEELQAMVGQFNLSAASASPHRAALAHHVQHSTQALPAPTKAGARKGATQKVSNRTVTAEEVIPFDDDTLKEF